MPVKTRPASSTSVLSRTTVDTSGRTTNVYTKLVSGSDTISYDGGPKYLNGALNWKSCLHTSEDVLTGGPILVGNVQEHHYRYPDRTQRHFQATYAFPSPTSSLPALPDGSFDPQCVANCLSQIDLNSTENVLLYSGVIQAVPLVGSVLKLSSILNTAARRFGKSLRKKPFTTAVKTLISADFVDRFVISPMLDDAHRFQAATDYVLNVINTARERNAHRFAVENELTSSSVGAWSTTSTFGICGGRIRATREERKGTMLRSKAVILLEARYDMMAVDPLKVWAQRVGLTRPLDSVWDLVPFSFVIDYFTRAGDFISALSDEMSNVEGLKGRITRILDAWQMFTRESLVEARAVGMSYVPASSYVFDYAKGVPGIGGRKRLSFSRTRIGNVFAVLRQLETDPMISLDLSSVQKRTIAELIIQSKL